MHIAGKVKLANVDESGVYEKLLGNVYGHLKSHPPNLSLVCPTWDLRTHGLCECGHEGGG